ncbi:MAG: hypothetical protein AAF290_08555 [Pseudomonadota bacterium]
MVRYTFDVIRVGLVATLLALTGCATKDYIAPDIDLTREPDAVAESELLDIGILELDAGLPGPDKKLADDVYPDIRRAEARYFPYHLKSTLQSTGHWGAVRVVPSDQVVADVMVGGTIRHSDGNRVDIQLYARDVSGDRWFQRRYQTRTDRNDYGRDRDRRLDPYQNIFNEFANDLYEHYQTLGSDDIERLRRTARLKFYADMAPTAFGDYVEEDGRGQLTVVRLPAPDDPMARRLEKIRTRDALFQDTLNEHYANFYYGIALPYADWREASRESELEYQRLRRSALLRGLAGVAMVAAASEISRGDAGDSGTERRTRSTLKNYAIAGGLETAFSAFGQLAEAKVQRLAISELSESFGQLAAPMVVEVDGQTQRLTGTAAAQYDQWRELLRRINAQETGFDDDPRIGINGRMSDGENDAG